jgi:outer membrane protein TolC
MRMQQPVRTASLSVLAGGIVALLSVAARPTPSFGQMPSPPATVNARKASSAQAITPVRRLSVDESVAMALESNLGIQADRLTPEIQDLAVAQARAAWTPTVYTDFTRDRTATPPESVLAGTAPTVSSRGFSNETGVRQQLPWGGGAYEVRWRGSRTEETLAFMSFNPRLRSGLDITFTQPLLADLAIDDIRRQVWTGQNLRQIADLELRQSVVTITRAVRNAYWDLVFALANLDVAQQALDLARQALQDSQTRAKVGMIAPIDIVEAEAEVARNEETVIIAETDIERAQDQLRVLISNPERPAFWNMRIEPTDPAVIAPVGLDVEAAVRYALANRTDLIAARRQIDNTLIDLRFYENQQMPTLDLHMTYGLVGLGGTKLEYGSGFPPPVVGQNDRGFGSVLSDVFTHDYKNWSVGLQLSYPVGLSAADASLTQARLRRAQAETRLRNLEMLITAAVRDTGRRVTTNMKRIEATQKARELAERRLEAEQKKFNVGLSTSFVVFQAQRDLAAAKANELRALIDHSKSLVDFDAVQQVPIP